MKINWGWGFNFLQMQNTATDQNFPPQEIPRMFLSLKQTLWEN